MILTDDHAHLDHGWLLKNYASMDAFIEAQEKAGVKRIIAQGVDKKTSEQALAFAQKYRIVQAAIGFYPPDTWAKDNEGAEHTFSSDDTQFAADMAWLDKNLDKAVAVGEIGLDYSYADTDREMQKRVFQKQLDLAKKHSLPVIVHSRKAEDDVVQMLIDAKVTGVLHCFSGKKKLIQHAYDHGLHFSIPTNIVRSEHFRMLVKMVDISRILTETDAPYMSPYKDEDPNEPQFIAESIKVIAKIKNMTQEETANAIFQNFQRLYL
ncbi:MAG: TatD family hydrolase [Nanoarchaeota archaeon]